MGHLHGTRPALRSGHRHHRPHPQAGAHVMEEKPEKVKLGNGHWALLGVVWIILAYLRAAHSLDDGFRFIFKTDKSYIGNYTDTITHHELWTMQNGVLGFLGILLGLFMIKAGFRDLLKFIKHHWKTRNSGYRE
ncbi:MAG: hypothetical protein AAF226_13000 [Verrucomicrobiota bacterium]